jgi:hypothetical protein
MKPSVRTGVIVTAVSVAVSFLTVCVPAAAAQPAPAAGPSLGGPGTWAYGGLNVRSWVGTTGSYGYDASATAGYVVILQETNGTSGNFTLSVNRTMGVILSVEYCLPSCHHPTDTATVYYHAWETVRATLGVTNGSSVFVNGTLRTVPALGLTSSSVSVQVGFRETTRVVEAGVLVRGNNISAALDANASTTFAPALGLFPLALVPGESWNASSAFVQTGTATYSILVQLLSGTMLNPNGTIPLAATGLVAVNGTYGGHSVRLGGANYDIVSLEVTGPFSVREGFLFIPTGADAFGGSSPSWLTNTTASAGSSTFSEENVDVAGSLTHGAHLGFYASKIVWSSGTSNPATDAVLGGGITPALEPAASDANATTIQGSPESVTQATTDQGCLAGGVGCPTLGNPRGLGPLLLVGVGAVVVTVIAIALVAERRRMPRTPYPNAGLYPPGPAGTGAPGPIRRPQPPQAPAADDPLSHLW